MRCTPSLAGAVLTAFLLAAAAGAQPRPAGDSALPTLIVEVREEVPGELQAVAERVRAFDRSRLEVAMDLTGLDAPGPPILLLVVAEGTAVARQTPPWVSGYARGERSLTVVFPGRIPRYPDRSLEAVIQHEVAHVLVHRAAAGRGVPRWFNEGVAMAAGRAWSLEDRGRLTWGVLTGGPGSLLELDAAFARGSRSAATAYALSSALVRDLQEKEGASASGEILARVRAGEPFADAFAAVVGRSLTDFERSFFRRQTFWNRWLPFLTSSTALWIGVTFLFLAAYRRRRERDAEIARRWEEEDRRAWAAVRLRVLRGEREGEGEGSGEREELVN